MPDEFEQYRAQPVDEFEKYRANKNQAPQSIAGKFNNLVEQSGLPAMGGGILQGAANLATILPNAFIKSVNEDINSVHPGRGNFPTLNVDLKKYNKEGVLPSVAFKAGEYGLIPGTGTPTALVKLIAGLAKKTGSKLSFPFVGSFKNLSPLEQKVQQATESHTASTEAEQAAKLLAQSETGKSSQGALQYSKNQKLQESEQLPSILPEETQKGLLNATAEHDVAKQNLSEAQNKIDYHLNKGATHDVRAASRIDEIVSEKKKDIGKMYDTVEKDLEDKSIKFENTDTNQDIMKELTHLLKTGKEKSSQANELLERMNNLGKDKEIGARDYLATFRTLRDYARDARKLAYKPGITDEARQAAFARADELENKVEEMRPILEKGIGEESSALLKKANGRWSSEIAPLHRNKFYQKVRYEGRLPSNIIKELRGNGAGMSQLKDVIKNDPELLSNVVGQRYEANPMEIHSPNELTKEYTEKMPELQTMLGEHTEATKALSQAESKLSEAEKIHKGSLKYAETKEEISKLDEHIDNLESITKRKNTTLREKMSAEKQLKMAKSKRRKARTLLGLGATAAGVASGLKWIGKAIGTDNTGE